MSKKSNNQGRAYEFAFLKSFETIISPHKKVEILKTDGYLSAKRAWNTLEDSTKNQYLLSASTGIQNILELEPNIIETTDDHLTIHLQTDDKGADGDVRDLIIIRSNIGYEIGLSIKHNHFAVKHSRLSNKIDFGQKWYGIPCSQKYWDDITPIFDSLRAAKLEKILWSQIPNKEEDIYVPILSAFKAEVEYQYQQDASTLLKNLVEYLLGKFDFYKVVSIDKSRTTIVQSFNLRGKLNHPSDLKVSKIKVPKIEFPTRIISLDFKPNHNNTLELFLDNGWQFSFRIHNASSRVEPSLKFDIQLIGLPSSIMLLQSQWTD